MSTLARLAALVRPPRNRAPESQPLPKWKIVSYSGAIIAMLYAGIALARLLNVTDFRETVETVPVLICVIFVLRLPARPPLKIHGVWRALFLLSPFLLLSFADLDFPMTIFDRSTVLAVVVVESIAIGVSEELTFRFSLHRLWSQYSATFYVIGSALIFGVLHIPNGAEVAIVSTVIGVMFGLARIAGMPIAALIVMHGFVDAPGIIRDVVHSEAPM